MMIPRKQGHCQHCKVVMTKILGKVPKLCSKCKPIVGISSRSYDRNWTQRLKYREDLDAWLTDDMYADVLDVRQDVD